MFFENQLECGGRQEDRGVCGLGYIWFTGLQTAAWGIGCTLGHQTTRPRGDSIYAVLITKPTSSMPVCSYETQQTSWIDPTAAARVGADAGSASALDWTVLPHGWQETRDAQGAYYFIKCVREGGKCV